MFISNKYRPIDLNHDHKIAWCRTAKYVNLLHKEILLKKEEQELIFLPAAKVKISSV